MAANSSRASVDSRPRRPKPASSSEKPWQPATRHRRHTGRGPHTHTTPSRTQPMPGQAQRHHKGGGGGGGKGASPFAAARGRLRPTAKPRTPPTISTLRLPGLPQSRSRFLPPSPPSARRQSLVCTSSPAMPRPPAHHCVPSHMGEPGVRSATTAATDLVAQGAPEHGLHLGNTILGSVGQGVPVRQDLQRERGVHAPGYTHKHARGSGASAHGKGIGAHTHSHAHTSHTHTHSLTHSHTHTLTHSHTHTLPRRAAQTTWYTTGPAPGTTGASSPPPPSPTHTPPPGFPGRGSKHMGRCAGAWVARTWERRCAADQRRQCSQWCRHA